ncbi:MAG: limonene-1,2-epoxide hydrolase family protein [Candidatus Thorarchaeota archaeon]|jgi:limonene-1,2-epoxide hydrolase
MALFSENEMHLLNAELNEKKGHVLITFRNKHGPTKLGKLWNKLIGQLGYQGKCLSWWSSTGTMGLLECETTTDKLIYGQWALADETQLVGVFEIDDDEIVNIRDGFDAGNVVSSEMRAIRIGETGDKD